MKRLPGLFLYTPHQVFIRYTQPARIKGCHPFLCAIFMQQTEETIYQLIEPGVIAYFDRYDARSGMGYRFSLEHFEDKKMISRLTANSIKYDSLYN